MVRQLRCRDVTGDCEAVVTGEDDDAILEQAVPHATQAHGLEDSAELRDQLRNAAQDV